MKLLIIAFFTLISLNSFAAKDNLGLGVIIGAPTGISGNYKFSETRSLDAALSYDFDHDDEFYFHSTYLFRRPKTIQLEEVALGWYAGIGGRMRFEDDRDDDFRLGARGSLGSNLEFKDVPIEIFAELNLVMDIIEETDLDLGAALGARYYF